MKDKRHEYASDAIRVSWSSTRCIHSAECVRGLPIAFRPGEKPWIRLDGLEAEQVARVVVRCPTGALHFEPSHGGPREETPAANDVRVSANGPTYLRGDIEIRTQEGEVLLRDTRVALCRCGRSANKPLCDNAHRAAGFRDPGELIEADSVQDPGVAIGPTLRVVLETNGPARLEGPFTLASADGGTRLAGTSTWLCRCGHSKTKPFCDGSHAEAGFDGG
jgi:CDGSH-type Zn-finger protein/uncharacterized Fe-S cluster protein YjdI